jgi:cyclopropane fatty-acyl-phospholipid synthase-like methyltransferase
MISEKISQIYDSWVTSSGNNIHSVGWFSRETQQKRFEVLSSIIDLSGSSLLDVGCGLGDLYKYLSDKAVKCEYRGIDVSCEMISHAKDNYPKAKFEQIDLSNINEKYDYVFASGSFNIKVNDNYEYIEEQIRKMVAIANKGVVFNLLSSYTPEKDQDDFFSYYKPEMVFSMCKRLVDNVVLRHDYLSNDCSFLMLK